MNKAGSSQWHKFITNDISFFLRQEKNVERILLGAFVLTAFIYLGFTNHSLFHLSAEVFSSFIAFTIGVVALNTYGISKNAYFPGIAIAACFVGIFDLLHSFTYQGIHVLGENTLSISIQLKMIARYIQGFTVLFYAFYTKKTVKPKKIFFLYLSISVLLLLSVFWWHVFPECYIPGLGFTTFKKVSEIIICTSLLTGTYLILKKKPMISKNTFLLIIASVMALVFSEVAFVFYKDMDDWINITGHMMKIISFYLIYKAIIEASLKKPFELLFYGLNQTNYELQKKTEQLEKTVEKLNMEIREHQKVREKLERSREEVLYEKLKTEFFSNISHELKTPLNVILGALQLLDLYIQKEVIVDKENNVKKYAKVMRQNCYRLLRLATNFIDITKMDSGYFKLNMHNYNIVSVIEDIVQSIVQYAENNGIEVVFDTEVEEKMMAFDPDAVERIVLNLLSNAIKHTPTGGSIMVNLYDDGEFMRFSVKDTGIGIPQNQLKAIFERFRQTDKAFTKSQEGSGIGLAIVRALVEMHQGKICVLSTIGEGSEFIIELPVKVCDQEETDANVMLSENRIEKINVEFSDIYA